MAPSYEHWRVSGIIRPISEPSEDGEWSPTGEREQVAVITDDRGWVWEVVLDGSAVASLAVRPQGGGRLTQATLRGTQLSYLRDAAVSYWREVDSILADPEPSERHPEAAINVTPVEVAMLVASGEIGELGTIVGKPNMGVFAAVWKSTPARATVEGKVVTRREALRARYRRPDGSKVSAATIDSWVREARDLGLIGAPTTGRPAKPRTS